MARVIWTEPALDELDAIADYIALDKPKAARSLVQRVFQKVGMLGCFPNLGTRPAEVKDLPYRQLIISPCRVFYRVEGKKIYIVSVLRGETRIPKIFS
ncbi:MAG: type II toxin-antitoxin system RelE/ParE family toxin [Deltaproteobacteria bacterium]|nr:type II toxin-antitoxin system RelE/ParE family toxin [Deltaproteobacteria bacterium]